MTDFKKGDVIRVIPENKWQVGANLNTGVVIKDGMDKYYQVWVSWHNFTGGWSPSAVVLGAHEYPHHSGYAVPAWCIEKVPRPTLPTGGDWE